ncbi:ATP-binding protein [Alloalcanivorax gelatiniphagus]|uniref:histidine kinase n=1 Tax=Alloalcanivorax gelatiniphagus TaxID=1194167 RepID=A0ABY2XQA0_9GAMM|nr:ATP-binding protein [Alloalcanivorax gelatiniphagus]TMW14851.1 HAMP domain-containing protein [Alloalcanivorax gelatiniphagus]
MSSIFVRIYGGILVALLIIGALTYAGVELVNDYRSLMYRERMAKGTFYLMAEGYRGLDEAGRQARSLYLSRLFGAPVAVDNRDGLGLSYREALHLDEGRVVLRARDDDATSVDVLYPLPDSPLFLRARLSRLSEQQARATARLVLDALGKPGAGDQALAGLREQFGYPLAIQPVSSLLLDGEQRQRLLRGEVVFSLSDSTSRNASVRVLAPVDGGDQATSRVLVLGPMYLFDPFPWQLLAIAGVLALLMVAVSTYLQVRPLQTRLRRLGRAVQRLGAGDLAAYADVRGNDPIGQVAATFNGMTAHIRRLIEAQREMTRAVSHELRTPVARLRFGLEMLADCESAEERREKLNALDRDIDQLDRLIDEILTYARLEEGTPTVDFQPVFLREICEQLAAELDGIRGDIAIEVEGDPDLTVDGDPRYLHRIMQNLVTNALRYAASRVRMTLREEGDCLVLDVDDDGKGIPEHQRERVFKPFARLDKSRHRASGGYGLGLSIVKRIIEWHGGDIQVGESEWGGARFRVILPRHQQEQHVLGRGRPNGAA